MSGEDLNLLNTVQKPFAESLRAQKRSISTILAYTKDVSQMVEFLRGKNISQASLVTPTILEDFKNYLIQQGYTLKSVSRKLNSVKTFFRFLKSQGVIAVNPADSVAHPKYETKPPRILSPMEYRALRDACREDVRIAALVELLLQTGIRIGEASRLKLNDIQTGQLYIEAYQSQPARTIPLNKAAELALKHYLDERPKTKTKNIFVTKTGRPFLTRNIRAAVDRYFRTAGIENAYINNLRSTWLAQHLAAGASPLFLSKIAGHKRLATTEKYLEFIQEKTSGKGKVELEEL